jgi:hypothetical protein
VVHEAVAGQRNQERGHRTKTGSPYKVQSWPKVGLKLALQDGQGFGIRPLFSVGAKGAEAATKGARFGAHFTQMYVSSQFLASHLYSERGKGSFNCSAHVGTRHKFILKDMSRTENFSGWFDLFFLPTLP